MRAASSARSISCCCACSTDRLPGAVPDHQHINRITANDDESIHTLSAALLKDFSLINKLLRLVNSSTYGQFGGKISTISRAVMIMGFGPVRNLAITLILFEHMQNKAQASELKEEVVLALFSGIMAQNIARTVGSGNAEEGFICGVFHRLGRILAMYYLYDESMEISNRVQQALPTRMLPAPCSAYPTRIWVSALRGMESS